MISWTRRNVATGETADAMGGQPDGYITYGPDGRMMVVVVRADRQAPAALVPTQAEKLDLYDSMFAYAGTYAADDEKVTHFIDISYNQAWTGTEQVRLYSIEGRRLTYVSEPAKNPIDGETVVHTVIFDKVV
jgi:hypothetical protein